MACSLEQLIEEWERKAESYDEEDNLIFHPDIDDCISDLRDTMIVMESEEVRKHD